MPPDVGASGPTIINGKITVKSDPTLQGLDETGPIFDRGDKA